MSNEAAATALIETARSFLGMTLREARDLLGADAHIVPGDEYGRLRDVTSLESAAVFPGTLYVEADEVRLVRVNRNGLQGMTRADLCSQMEGDPIRLRSRAGKTAQLLVYASQGVAFSSEGADLHFLEAFSPCTQREYETQYYRAPGTFIR
ncbi:MAG: hypothetical protein ACOCVK_01755 [bacterium]